jgi:hypothetical protein
MDWLFHTFWGGVTTTLLAEIVIILCRAWRLCHVSKDSRRSFFGRRRKGCISECSPAATKSLGI